MKTKAHRDCWLTLQDQARNYVDEHMYKCDPRVNVSLEGVVEMRFENGRGGHPNHKELQRFSDYLAAVVVAWRISPEDEYYEKIGEYLPQRPGSA